MPPETDATTTTPATAPAAPAPGAASSPAPAAPNGGAPPIPTAPLPSGTTVAGGAETPPDGGTKSYWPDDWREKAAEHFSGGDKKKLEKELVRLQGFTDPTAVYASYRSMENTWSSKQFVKLPGKDATPEEVAEYHKALGVPAKPEDYLKSVKLDNGAVIGDADKPIVDAVLKELHQAGAPPAVVNRALNWYYASQEKAAADLDERDEKHRLEQERALKDEWGPRYRRTINSIKPLFGDAPENLHGRLLGGRMADGTIIGNDPDFIKWIAGKAMTLNPYSAVVDDADPSGKSVATEIAEIKKIMRENRPLYDKEYAKRYEELIKADLRAGARKSA